MSRLALPLMKRRLAGALLCAGAVLAGAAVPAGEIVNEGVAYDPQHPDHQVAARQIDIYDLRGLGTPPVALLQHLRPTEQLDYQAYLGPLPVGSINFTLRAPIPSTRGGHNIRAQLKIEPADAIGFINKALAGVFDASLEMQTTMDADRGRSILFTRNEIVKDQLALSETLRLDYGKPGGPNGRTEAVARFSEDKYPKNKPMRQRVRAPYAIPPSVQDALSSFYYARALPYERVGDRHRIALATKKDLEEVVISVVGSEIVDLGPLGRYDCWVIRPQCDGDSDLIVKAKGSALMWLEKNSRVITKMQIQFDLAGVDGIKIVAPLTAIRNNPALEAHRLDRRPQP